MKRNITYGKSVINYEVDFKDVKHINLKVNPRRGVVVSAPSSLALEKIDAIIKTKAEWIIKSLEEFDKVRTRPKYILEYHSGEPISYLGRNYQLKVIESDENYVRYFQGRIEINVTDKSNFKLKQNLIEEWLKNKAVCIFNETLVKMYPKVKKYGVEQPSIKIRSMKTRWGSCQYDKHQILLNYELIKAPKYSIEYVVLHELIHFIHNDHSESFYDMLSVMMPDWKKRKAILDEDIVRDL